MRIDRFMPRYDVCARYETTVDAPAQRAYAAARHLDMRGSRLIRSLYRLRGMPDAGLTLDGMLAAGFILLADAPSREIVIGLVGRFWSVDGAIEPVSADRHDGQVHFLGAKLLHVSEQRRVTGEVDDAVIQCEQKPAGRASVGTVG